MNPLASVGVTFLLNTWHSHRRSLRIVDAHVKMETYRGNQRLVLKRLATVKGGSTKKEGNKELT